MVRTLSVIGFGGCPVNNPIQRLAQARFVVSAGRRMGFEHLPYALSSGSNLQLLSFLRGEIDIPYEVRQLAYGDPKHVPTAEQSAILDTVDLGIIEMSTPIEYYFKGFVINPNRFVERVLTPLRARPHLKRPGNHWNAHGLRQGNDETRQKYAEDLLKLLNPADEEERYLIDIVENTTSFVKRKAEMQADLEELRRRYPIPMMVVLHHFNYMPDGRPVSMPPEFTEESRQAAVDAGYPLFDPAPMVAEAGVEVAMAEDNRHYKEPYYRIVGEEYLRFVEKNQIIAGYKTPF